MKNYFLILTIISLLSCQNVQTKAIQQEKTVVKSDSISHRIEIETETTAVNYTSKDSCENVQYIFKVINTVLNSNNVDYINITQFENAFKVNSNNEKGCYFPNGNSEGIILYKFTDALEEIALEDTDAIRMLAILYRHNNRNAEYSEYFYRVFPKVAVENTKGFIQALHSMDFQTRKITIGKLEMIKTKKDLDKLVENLKTINAEGMNEAIYQLKDFLSTEFLVEFE
ncbi:hypothetical protein [Saccharicrinis aurantiacus]|uniref:hypothetical protein n=1 Tax=Saccharicrinis aurantiacus TaxID=1849719 RepID=UPI000838BD39|nr:hypothetical protein [Saccharicrinis aurantiacus]